MQAQAAIHTRWARTAHPDDRRAATEKAREGALLALEKEADPNNRLDPARRREAALQLQRSRLIDMNRRRAKATRQRKERLNSGSTSDDGAA